MVFRAGTMAGRWLLWSEENGVMVRAPTEVRSVLVDYGIRTSNLGGTYDARQSSVRVSGEPLTVQLQFEFRADHALDDVMPEVRKLERLAAHDRGLGRPPVVKFRYGRHLGMDRAEVAQLRIEWRDSTDFAGNPRAAIVHLRLASKEKRELEPTGRFVRETRQVRLGPYETFESVAWDAYGDPDLGVLLRRVNPDIPLDGEADDDVVRVLDTNHPAMQESIEPRAPALLGETAYLQQIAEERLGQRGPGAAVLEAELGL